MTQQLNSKQEGKALCDLCPGQEQKSVLCTDGLNRGVGPTCSSCSSGIEKVGVSTMAYESRFETALCFETAGEEM